MTSSTRPYRSVCSASRRSVFGSASVRARDREVIAQLGDRGAVGAELELADSIDHEDVGLDHPIDRIFSAAQVVLVVVPGVMFDEREMTIPV